MTSRLRGAPCFRIDPTRAQKAAKALLGENFDGILISDSYAGYHWIEVLHQQLCLAHLARQYTELSQRQGDPGQLGRALVYVTGRVFAVHREYRQEGHDLAWLQATIAPHKLQMRELLTRGTEGTHEKTARFCRGVLEEFDALWTFTTVEGVETTNNR